MSTPAPRFGVWTNVHGTWGSFRHPDDPVDASWARNRAQVLELEELGYDSTLIAQHTINPLGHDYDQLEAWSATAALAAITERIELITAIKPLLYHPVVLAKQLTQIQEISGGRASINLVNAWYRPELERAGIPFPAHDERYAYGREWLEIVTRLAAGETVRFDGRHFSIDDYAIRPSGALPAPRVYGGGESEAGRALLADRADAYFLNGRPLEEVRDVVADLRRRPRSRRSPLRFALAAFVIARDSDEEAQEELARGLGRVEADHREWQEVFEGADRDAVMFQRLQAIPAVGSNGGTAAGLVGSYDAVAERILAFNEAGIETFMLQFQPLEAETRRFAHEAIPRVRRRVAVAA